ncbi:MAG: two-component system sensor histidine kinase NtrB [Planctomycetota bacterium]|jgi:two-component system NtrC family sensor kinase
MKIEDEITKEFLHNILASMEGGLFTIDAEARITSFNRAAEKITGFKKEEVLHRKCYTILRSNLCKGKCRLKRTLETGESIFNSDAIIRNKAGKEIHVNVTTSALRSGDNEIIGALEIFRDLTERKQLWDQLRVERDRAQQYLRVARVIIVALDLKGRVTLINKMGCEVLGCEEDEIIGNNWFDFYVPEEVREQVRNLFGKLMAGEVRVPEYYENPISVKDGQERIIAWHNTILTDKAGHIVGTLSSGEDVTERKRTEAELIRSEKLASVGQLAAGVAHEVNNPLAGILVYIKLLLKKYEQGKLHTEETKKQLHKIEKETERCSRIIKNLLDFSRQTEVTLRPVDINKVIEATLSIIGHQIGLENIRIEQRLCTPLPLVLVDFDQIQQALMNIMLNAAQAMPGGGELTITTSVAKGVRIDSAFRDALRIDISDTGVGIPRENLGKLFTPFFTTKQKGKGVGLGLSVVHGIIERHHGKIEIQSDLGAGTTFSIYLGITKDEENQVARCG